MLVVAAAAVECARLNDDIIVVGALRIAGRSRVPSRGGIFRPPIAVLVVMVRIRPSKGTRRFAVLKKCTLRCADVTTCLDLFSNACIRHTDARLRGDAERLIRSTDTRTVKCILSFAFESRRRPIHCGV